MNPSPVAPTLHGTGRATPTAARAARAPAPLVVVFCRGGTDGLTLLRPLEDPVIESKRPGLVVPAESVTPVGEGFGLHPALSTTAERFAAGQVALIPACGLPEASRSHFSAQFAVERCDGGDSGLAGGWLGRHLARTALDQLVPFRAVSLGQPHVPPTLAGSTDVLAAASLADLALADQAPSDGPSGSTGGSAVALDRTVLGDLWAGDDGPLGLSSAAALEVLAEAAELAGTATPQPGPSAPPPTDAESALRALGRDEDAGSAAAEMVKVFGAGLSTEVGMLNIGGWDHHAGLGPTDGAFAQKAAELDSTLDVLLSGIPGVTVLVVSEFGRRVAANDSEGSDHGRGGVVMLLGERTRGGVHGDWPGLVDLEDGDVRVANDVQSVFAEVVEVLFDADGAALLPGAPSVRLGLLS